MNNQALLSSLVKKTDSKIVMCVLDGAGGLPSPQTGLSELQSAFTPNLDGIARDGVNGLMHMVDAGITPGSAPGHLGLFGYDPLEYEIGRGVLEAMGIDFPLEEGDIAIRGNFCTLDGNGLISDRRAGRLPTEICARQCALLDGKIYNGVRILAKAVKDHRFVIVLRGKDLSAKLCETDPQSIGLPPITVSALDTKAEKTAKVLRALCSDARELFKNETANFFLLRGYSLKPNLPSMEKVYKLKSAAVVAYPMYRGLAKVVGMDIIQCGATLTEEVDALKKVYNDYDFIYMHAKATDAFGEDGNFQGKVNAIEEIDRLLAQIVALNPDVLVVTSDHSTPAIMAAHSWHMVPVALKSKYCRTDSVTSFNESAALGGGLGIFKAKKLMNLLLANALKLNKFGA